MSFVSLSNVVKRYTPKAPPALKSIDLKIDEGEFLCLLGPSGCGKTTTLRLISGLEYATDGIVTLNGKVVDDVHRGVFTSPEKRELGLVFQSYALWPHLNVYENIAFGLKLRKLPKAEIETRVIEVMEKLGIHKYRDRFPSQISGGQQQRVALARMLVINPSVLLMDEPLSNLDAKLRLEMRAELKRIHSEFGTTIIFVTHDQWEAMTLATRIVVMSEGEIQQEGVPTDIYERPANRFVAEFVGTLPINMIDLSSEDPEPVALRLMRFLSTTIPELGRPGNVGIRPESLRVVKTQREIPRGTFRSEARVLDVVPTGGNWIIEVSAAQRKLHALVDDAPDFKVGDDVFIWTENDQLHIFDEAGDRSVEADAVLQNSESSSSSKTT